MTGDMFGHWAAGLAGVDSRSITFEVDEELLAALGDLWSLPSLWCFDADEELVAWLCPTVEPVGGLDIGLPLTSLLDEEEPLAVGFVGPSAGFFFASCFCPTDEPVGWPGLPSISLPMHMKSCTPRTNRGFSTRLRIPPVALIQSRLSSGESKNSLSKSCACRVINFSMRWYMCPIYSTLSFLLFACPAGSL